jgi:hypothetical protein
MSRPFRRTGGSAVNSDKFGKTKGENKEIMIECINRLVTSALHHFSNEAVSDSNSAPCESLLKKHQDLGLRNAESLMCRLLFLA